MAQMNSTVQLSPFPPQRLLQQHAQQQQRQPQNFAKASPPPVLHALHSRAADGVWLIESAILALCLQALLHHRPQIVDSLGRRGPTCLHHAR